MPGCLPARMPPLGPLGAHTSRAPSGRWLQGAGRCARWTSDLCPLLAPSQSRLVVLPQERASRSPCPSPPATCACMYELHTCQRDGKLSSTRAGLVADTQRPFPGLGVLGWLGAAHQCCDWSRDPACSPLPSPGRPWCRASQLAASAEQTRSGCAEAGRGGHPWRDRPLGLAGPLPAGPLCPGPFKPRS